MKWLFVVVGLVLCAGCMSRSKKMAAWQGRPAGELVTKWGAPDSMVTLADGRQVITYISAWGTYGEYGGGSDTCKESFTIDPNGNVESWSHSGCPGRLAKLKQFKQKI